MKLYCKWFGLWLCSLPLLIISFFIVPVLVLFEKDNHLPKLFRWFETDDHDLTGGNDWKRDNPDYNTYWKKVLWLWRNPIYTFDHEVLGFRYRNFFYSQIKGVRNVGNKPEGVPGWLRIDIWESCLMEKHLAFQFYYIRPWPGETKCIRINVGWKMQGLAEYGSLEDRSLRQFVFSVHPYMPYDKKV